MRNAPIIVTVTCATRREARAIADTLVKERLAACVTISGEVNSRYRWKGKTEESREFVVTAKTLASRWGSLVTRVKALHSYEVPEILAVRVAKAEKKYLQWIWDGVE